MRLTILPVVRRSLGLLLLIATWVFLSACAASQHRPSTPPVPIDFAQAMQYAQRCALIYESDAAIRLHTPAGTSVAIMPETASGIKAFVETDDVHHVQWVVVRGTSNVANIRLDVDYNKVIEARLQVPLHKGFADAALLVYRFVKPLLKPGYDTRVTGHSLGGAAAVIVLMLLKEDGVMLGPALTFGQPKVTNREGVSKYHTLPLLRFVNDRDPVPQLPPLEIFAVLDEGPFQHLGPEVVLEDGATYLYFDQGRAARGSLLSFWQSLGNQQIPDHSIAEYLRSLRAKVGP